MAPRALGELTFEAQQHRISYNRENSYTLDVFYNFL